MKKIFLAIGVGLLSTAAVNAQEGTFYLGGNVGFNVSKSSTTAGNVTVDGPKNTTWSFSPEVGTFLTNKIQLGIAPTISGTAIEDGNKTSTYGGTIYARHFWGSEAFKPFAGIAVSAGGGNTKDDDGDKLSTNTSFGANLNAGFGYALSSKVTAVGSFGVLGYQQSENKATATNVKTKQSSFGLNSAGTLGSRFNVGIYVTL